MTEDEIVHAFFLAVSCGRLEWMDIVLSTTRSLDLADSIVSDWSLHWIVFERGDLSGAVGDVGQQAEAIVLPQV